MLRLVGVMWPLDFVTSRARVLVDIVSIIQSDYARNEPVSKSGHHPLGRTIASTAYQVPRGGNC